MAQIAGGQFRAGKHAPASKHATQAGVPPARSSKHLSPQCVAAAAGPAESAHTAQGTNTTRAGDPPSLPARAAPGGERQRRRGAFVGMTVCSVEGCEEGAHIRGWCRKHYGRWQRHGSATAGRTPNGEPLQWLRDAVSSASDQCCEWPFNTDKDGYGRVRFNSKFQRVNRLALELSGRPCPSPEHQALHEPCICHNPRCVNPNHLRWGLPHENTQDRIADGTAALGAKNPAAKLTASEVSNIRRDNRVHRVIAREYGVSRSQISRIKRGDAW